MGGAGDCEMRQHFGKAQLYRERADELRVKALCFKSPCQHLILQIAHEYEAMASTVEDIEETKRRVDRLCEFKL
jgi:uncharacterized coiled-coil DUF342 family protein